MKLVLVAVALLVLLCACQGGPYESRWTPNPSDSWQIQLQGDVITAPGIEVYDVDIDSTSAQLVKKIHHAGAHGICYFNAGALENWRTDVGGLPRSVVGKPLEGWAGEYWLDIRQLDVLKPLLTKRIDTCKAKGFDAIDPDNIDGYQNDSGFALTENDSIAYVQLLSELAHDRGMSVGLKNGLSIPPRTAAVIDFAINEQCQQYQECAAYKPLAAAGKTVLNIEYSGGAKLACENQPAGLTTVYADLDLGGKLIRC